ncbi:MAG: hypothetical protein AB7V43_22120 [Acidimicrobiia bacterium]
MKNRDRFTLTGFTATAVTVSGKSGTVILPLWYAQDFLELGYAQTGHGSQGRTVDTAILLIDSPIDVRGVYVPMTRGRHSNTAYVVCDDGEDPVEVFADALTRDWIDQPAHVRYAELNPTPIGPGIVQVPELLPDEVLAELIGRGERLGAVITALNDRLRAAPALVATAEADKERLIAARANVTDRITGLEERLGELDRFGHRHRNRPAITETRQRLQLDRTELDALDQQIAEADATLVERRRGLAGIDDLRAERDRYSAESHQITEQLDTDAAHRAVVARDDLRVIGEIGTRPIGHEAIGWDRVAGRLAQQRIAFSSRNAFEINYYLEHTRRQQADPTTAIIERKQRSNRSIDDDYGISL